MSQIGEPLIGFYDQRLVALSLFISILASYVGLDLATRVSAARGIAQRAWWGGGAISLGLGIWSMHFVGMMAFRLPIPVRYDLPTVLISLFAAILASAVALYVVSGEKFDRREALGGSLLMGGGIATMHYIGMAAMRLSATWHYDPLLLALSVVIAVVASLAALTFAFDFREEPKGTMWARFGSSCLMGIAIASMHYVGMASARFTESRIAPDYSHAVDISDLGMAGIVATMLLVSASTLWAGLESKRRKRTRELVGANEALRSEIAERKLSEQALKQAEDRLRLILDTTPAMLASSLPNGYHDYFNRRWLDYVGRSLEDLQGSGWKSTLHPEEAEQLLNKWRASLASGEPFSHEAPMRRADGVYRWMLLRSVPLRDEHGDIVKWYGSSIDIEDLKRAEDHLRLVLDTTPALIFSARPDGYVDYLNQRWLEYVGLSLAHVQGWAWTTAIHPEDVEGIVAKWRAALANGKPLVDEARMRRADGEYRWTLFSKVPLKDDHGNIIKWYGSAIDIDDRKQAEEELRRLSGRLLRLQDEERRRITRELHDTTGQNLVVLATMLGQLRSSIPSGSRTSRKLASKCEALADQCIREVRTLSYVLHPPTLDQAGLEEAIRDYVGGFSKRSGIQVDLEVSPPVGRIAGDIGLALFRVVQESLTNVQRHSGSQRARIRIHRNSDLTLEISDSGRSGAAPKGIEESRFKAGVGIASMQERVKFLGGRFDIDSTSQGTTVRVTIPLGGKRE